MFKYRLGSDDTFLLLAPRWGDLDSACQIGLLAALFLVPLILIVWLYRHELQLISRLAACGLLVLRLSILAVIWVAVGVQPHFEKVSVEEKPGRVRVAV